MPDYTVAQMLLAIRKDHPEFANTDDKSLLHAVSIDHPDLVKGAKEFQVAPQGVTDNRSAGQVAYDQTGKFLGGMWGAVTGIPGMVGEGVGLAKDLLTGDNVSAQNRVVKAGEGLYDTATAPFKPLLKQFAPDWAGGDPKGATQQDWEHGAEAGGNITGQIALAAATGAAKKYGTAENLQATAEKLKAYRAANPVGQDVAKLGLTSSVGDLVKPVASAGAAVAAPILEKLAKIRQGQIAPAQTNPIPDATEQARMAMQPTAQAPIASSRGADTAFQERFTPEELAAQASDHGAAGPQGSFSSFPQGPDSTNWQAVNDATANKSLGIREPEDITGQPAAAATVETTTSPVPPHVQRVADALIRRGRGAGGADLAITNAQHLLEVMPEVRALSDVPNPTTGISPFDQAITDRLNTVGHEIGTKLAQEAVGKSVDTTDAYFHLEELANQAAGYGDVTLRNKILKLAQTFNESGTTDAGQVITTRQKMFDSALDISSGLGRDVYEVFKDLSEKIAPGIRDLNKKYFTLKTSAELAELRTGGTTPESQVGAGTRPKADYRDRVAAEGDAEKAAGQTAKDAEKAAAKAKADKAAEIRRQQKFAEQPKGFKTGPL